jgi:hypothetical protein
MRLAIETAGSLFARGMHAAIGTHSPNYVIPTTPEVTAELEFWAQTSRTTFVGSIWRTPTITDITLNSDAGGLSWGGICNKQVAQGFFTPDQRARSSTQRELWAATYCLQSFRTLLRNRSILLLTDSANTQRCISHGSTIPSQHESALTIFWLMHSLGAQLQVQWVPREENDKADAVTHWVDPHDWQLDPTIFQQLDAAWGPHTIDRFASHTNHLLPTFNSYMWCPDTAGVDAFAQHDWAAHTNWCHPPFSLVGHTIAIILDQRAAATVIVPLWRAASWWPSLVVTGGQCFKPFVVGCRELPSSQRSLKPGLGAASMQQQQQQQQWRMLALRIVSSKAPPASTPVPV